MFGQGIQLAAGVIKCSRSGLEVVLKLSCRGLVVVGSGLEVFLKWSGVVSMRYRVGN